MKPLLLILLLTLAGCDGEYQRLKAEAEFNAKVARTLPKKGELVTIRQYADGQYIVRRYEHGLKDTVIVARDE